MSSFSGELFVFTNNGDELLIKSGERNSIEICNRVSSFGEDYVSTKLRRGMETLKTHGIELPYAMWVDGLDTLILYNADAIIRRLHSALTTGHTMLIAAERNCWPDQERAVEYPLALDSKQAYINSGCFAGETFAMLRAMEIVAERATDENDQRAWTAAFLAGQLPFVQVDADRRLCVCQSDGRDYDTSPPVIHWNGRTPGRAEFFAGYFNGDR